MWDYIIAVASIVLLFQSSRLLRVGGLSLVATLLVHWTGADLYMLSTEYSVEYLQLTGMALYLLPLIALDMGKPLTWQERITLLCFLVLMSLEGIYLINYKEDIMNLAGFYDALINLICFSALILTNIKQGAQNGYNVLSGVLRLFISLRDNTLLHTKVGQLLAKQKGDSGFSSQKIKTEDLNVN